MKGLGFALPPSVDPRAARPYIKQVLHGALKQVAAEYAATEAQLEEAALFALKKSMLGAAVRFVDDAWMQKLVNEVMKERGVRHGN